MLLCECTLVASQKSICSIVDSLQSLAFNCSFFLQSSSQCCFETSLLFEARASIKSLEIDLTRRRSIQPQLQSHLESDALATDLDSNTQQQQQTSSVTMSTTHITGLVLGLACGAAMQNYTRKQVSTATESMQSDSDSQ